MKEQKTADKRQPKSDNRKLQAPSKSDLSSIPKPQLIQSIKRDIKRMVQQ